MDIDKSIVEKLDTECKLQFQSWPLVALEVPTCVFYNSSLLFTASSQEAFLPVSVRNSAITFLIGLSTAVIVFFVSPDSTCRKLELSRENVRRSTIF